MFPNWIVITNLFALFITCLRDYCSPQSSLLDKYDNLTQAPLPVIAKMLHLLPLRSFWPPQLLTWTTNTLWRRLLALGEFPLTPIKSQIHRRSLALSKIYLDSTVRVFFSFFYAKLFAFYRCIRLILYIHSVCELSIVLLSFTSTILDICIAFLQQQLLHN